MINLVRYELAIKPQKIKPTLFEDVLKIVEKETEDITRFYSCDMKILGEGSVIISCMQKKGIPEYKFRDQVFDFVNRIRRDLDINTVVITKNRIAEDKITEFNDNTVQLLKKAYEDKILYKKSTRAKIDNIDEDDMEGGDSDE